MRVKLTRMADGEIDAMIRWGAENFGVPAARQYYQGLLRILDLIADAPTMAVDVGKDMRAHPYRSHMIIYRQRRGGIEVLHIRYGRSNWRKFL